MGWMKGLRARLACSLRGHKRGKLDKELSTQAAKVYRCPRCSETWSRKITQAKAA